MVLFPYLYVVTAALVVVASVWWWSRRASAGAGDKAWGMLAGQGPCPPVVAGALPWVGCGLAFVMGPPKHYLQQCRERVGDTCTQCFLSSSSLAPKVETNDSYHICDTCAFS